MLAERAELNCLQGNRLPALGIVGFVDRASGRFRQFTENFEVADFCGHFLYCSIPSRAFRIATTKASHGGDSEDGWK
jgi:hypothetical protein